MKTIRNLSKSDRRGEHEKLPTEGECLEAAFAEFQDGLRMMEAGQTKRGYTRLRDAVCMAVEVVCAFRRSEFSALEVEMVFIAKDRASIRVIIPDWASKVREVQLGIIEDPGVIAMLIALIENKESGAIFHTTWHKPLSSQEAARGIARASSKSQLKVHLTFNKSRRIAVSSENSLELQQHRVRHTPGSVVTKAYQKHGDGVGLDKVRETLQKHAADEADMIEDDYRLPRKLGMRRSPLKPT